MTSSDPAPSSHRAWLWGLVGVQLLLLAAIQFIDYGWREPGQFGLTVGEQVLMALAYVPLWIGGTGLAIWKRAWAALAVQVLAPAAVLLWSMIPGLPLDPDDHQDLIGMTRMEVLETLDGRWIGESGDSLGSVLLYNGLDVHLTDERRVTRVIPGEDPVPGSEFPTLVADEHQDLVGAPYMDAYRTLLDRGGIQYRTEMDSTGTYDQFNGVRLYYEGVQRVREVTPSSM